MAGRISLTAFAGTDPRVNQTDISVFASATSELGIGIEGYTKDHFKLQLMHPRNLQDQAKDFFPPPVISAVNDLGNGYYEVVCRTKFGWPSQVILGLKLQKFTGGLGADRGQTLVSIALN